MLIAPLVAGKTLLITNNFTYLYITLEEGGGAGGPLAYKSKKWDLSREQARRADKGAVSAGRLRGAA